MRGTFHSPALRPPDEVIAAADRALYRAKEAGRDRTVAADRADAGTQRAERFANRLVSVRFEMDRAEVM